MNESREKNAICVRDDAPIDVWRQGSRRVSTGKMIKQYKSVPRWQALLSVVFRFICVAVALTAVFVSLFPLVFSENITPDDTPTALDHGGIPVSADTEPEQETSENVDYSPTVIDETGGESVLIRENNGDYSLKRLMSSGNGTKVIILHSHTSEMCSEKQSVTDLGVILAEQLNGTGIKNIHCTREFDSDGTVGAYGRMNGYLSELLESETETVCVIDLHSGDTDYPLTLTVSCGGNGWQENYALAEAICVRLPPKTAAIRLVPGKLGQCTGPLYLHVGIGDGGVSDTEARQSLYTFLSAFVGICTE